MVKFASPSCVCFISFGFLLATICVWVWMVFSLHSVTTGSRDRANVPLIIIIIIIITYIHTYAEEIQNWKWQRIVSQHVGEICKRRQS